jgi:bifunctional non-homologous end joining protein LigD
MSASNDPESRLETYRAKRSADASPEPFGGSEISGGGIFVVHKHDATRLHWDLRLEMGGVLESWAVPKGPSSNPADKRFAVKVEDHPLEYREFEGLIPEGNYGAGAMILWDRGKWYPVEDPVEGFKKGKLLFDLVGFKLRGRWTLVKTKQGDKDWLLIKERDSHVVDPGDQFPQDSVLSGHTVESLAAHQDKSAPILQALSEAGATQGSVSYEDGAVMLAEASAEPFSRADWLFEFKYDGYRLLAGKKDGKPFLISRNGNNLTASFPDVARAIGFLPFDDFLIDGEVVVHDDSGLPSFGRLQKRGRLTKRPKIERAALKYPAILYLFDLLAFDKFDAREIPLSKRKEVLRLVLPTVGPLRFSDHIEENGEALFAQVEKIGMEGMVGKRAASTYRAGRSSDWVKVRIEHTDEFVVVGFTEPGGARPGFGALHLAQYDGELVYCGSVGTGFGDKLLVEARKLLDGIVRNSSPCEGDIPTGGDNVWVEPEMVCEVKFKEFTDHGFLRHPSFQRFRDDKAPRECVLKQARASLEEPEVSQTWSADDKEVPFTNLTKVFWPVEGYSKGDLIEYYRAVSPWLLPFLKDRPLVLTRYPDGIEGKSFYQKDAPGFVPEWVRRERIWSEGSERELEYFVCDDEQALLYISNMGTIPLHIWHSRISSLELPDWCVLDLDPKGAPFTDVVAIARGVKDLCDETGLPCYAKTSGSSGIHILVPVGRQFTHEQSRMLGHLLAQVVVMRFPETATVTRALTRREGKVYIDYLQNGQGRLIAAPYCVRPLPGATVSAPLHWDEVDSKLRIEDFTIRNLPARMAELGRDPIVDVMSDAPDLMAALDKLGEMIR